MVAHDDAGDAFTQSIVLSAHPTRSMTLPDDRRDLATVEAAPARLILFLGPASVEATDAFLRGERRMDCWPASGVEAPVECVSAEMTSATAATAAFSFPVATAAASSARLRQVPLRSGPATVEPRLSDGAVSIIAVEAGNAGVAPRTKSPEASSMADADGSPGCGFDAAAAAAVGPGGGVPVASLDSALGVQSATVRDHEQNTRAI